MSNRIAGIAMRGKPLWHKESSAPPRPHGTVKGDSPLRTLREWLENHNVVGLSRRLDQIERKVATSYRDISEEITEIANDLAFLQAEWSERDDAQAIKLAVCVERLRDIGNRVGQ